MLSLNKDRELIYQHATNSFAMNYLMSLCFGDSGKRMRL